MKKSILSLLAIAAILFNSASLNAQEKGGKKKRPPVEETTDGGVPVRKAEAVNH